MQNQTEGGGRSEQAEKERAVNQSRGDRAARFRRGDFFGLQSDLLQFFLVTANANQ